LARQALPVEPEAAYVAELASSGVQRPALLVKTSSPEVSEPCAGISGGDVALEPLTAQEIEATHQRILALPQAARRELTTAFREHFQVPRNARSIGDRITQHRHSAFIDRFLEEFEVAQAPAEP
jgi:hypothetical protein